MRVMGNSWRRAADNVALITAAWASLILIEHFATRTYLSLQPPTRRSTVPAHYLLLIWELS